MLSVVTMHNRIPTTKCSIKVNELVFKTKIFEFKKGVGVDRYEETRTGAVL